MFIFSIIIISIIGTLSHFLYDISKHNKVVGLFTSVNESVWEHIKIALTPTLLFSIIDGYLYGINPNYFTAKLVSLITIILLMPILFYGYKFIFKKNNAVINILIFYIVIISSQYLFFNIIDLEELGFMYSYISCILMFVVFALYMILTMMPIKNLLFKDPITNKYGYKAHK